MDYKVLYRKYRPKDFSEIVGQDHIKRILRNSIVNNKIAHAYMFTGPRGTGKTSSAKIFAKTLNCLDPKDGISCGECECCKNFFNSPDIIEMDAASNNSVENIRELIENVNVASTSGKYKIYIIDEVHMLTNQAWNAFLKTLEEPPSNVIFILATTDIQKVPITVLSRCQRYDFQRIDRELIFNNLKRICDLEGIKYEDNALSEISYLSDGCMRDALSILDQLSKVSEEITLDVIRCNYGTVTSEEIDNLYSAIIHNDIDALVTNIQLVKSTGVDIKILIDKVLDNFIEKAVQIKKKNVSNNVFKQLKKIIDSLNTLLAKINNNSNGYLLLEMELISFINDDDNQITSREVNQIISREIIKVDTKIDVNDLLEVNNDKQIYKICDEFINIRINNSFVESNRTKKNAFTKLWDDFNDYVVSNSINEFRTLFIGTVPQVVSDTNVLFLTSSNNTKIIGNSKLFEFENAFNSKFNKNYKFIFISNADWNEFMKIYNKDMKFELKDDSEYVNNNGSSINMAKEMFGNESINIK